MAQFVPASVDEVVEQARLSRADVIAVWQQFEQAVEKWEENKTPVLVEWKEGFSRSFEPLEPALIDVMQSLQDGAVIEQAAWPVVLAIDAFIRAATDWAQAARENPRFTDPSGGKAVWDAYREVRLAMVDNLPERLESVSMLLSLRGMTPQHVAVIYDWYDEQGNPDVNRVEDERLNPGKHTNGMRNPAKVKREQEIAERWKARCEEFGGYDPSIFDGSPQTEQPSRQTPAPESYEELLALQGMTLQQVADMKMVSIEEVREHAREIALMNSDVAKLVGAELAAESLRVDTGRLHERTMIQAASMETYPELTTQERIWAMSDDGWNVGRICAGLRLSGLNVSYEQVLHTLAEKPEPNVRPRAEEAEKTSPQDPDSERPQRAKGRPKAQKIARKDAAPA